MRPSFTAFSSASRTTAGASKSGSPYSRCTTSTPARSSTAARSATSTARKGSISWTRRAKLTRGALRKYREVLAPAAAGGPCLVGGTAHTVGDGGGDGLVENAGDDVLRAQLRPSHAAGDGMCRRQLHLVVDGARARLEQAAEEARKAQHVVDLVRIVRAPGRHHPHVALRLLRLDLRYRVGHREDDGVACHALDVLHGQDARHRETDEDVRPLHRLGEAALDLARVGGRGHPLLHEVQSLGAAPVDGPV